MIVYTVVNHSPNQVEQWLAKYNIAVKYNIPKRSNDFYFVFGNSDLEKITNKKANVILFCGPLCASSLKAYHLDMRVNTDAPFYGIEYTSLNSKVLRSAMQQDCVPVKYNYTKNIIKKIESKSLLNALMTAIYTLPSSSQKPVKVAIINWLSYDGNIKSIDMMLRKLSNSIRLSNNNIQQLLAILESDIAQTYIDALREKGDTRTIASLYEVSEYDLNYMLKVRETRQEYRRRKNV